MRILVVTDDAGLAELLRGGLSEDVDNAVTASDGDAGLSLAVAQEFDAVVVDTSAAGRNVVDELRQRAHRPAIIVLAPANHEDQAAGADDYLIQPFTFPELVARISSAARRVRPVSNDHFSFGPFFLDISRRRLLCHGLEVQLTRSEYLLLRALAQHRGDTLSRRQLIQAVWGASVVSHGLLDTLVNGLREKLNVEYTGPIFTIRGSGYALVEGSELTR